jgi:hypothetical protein
MKTVWFASLVAAICLEGLGRRHLPQIPSVVFYFLKDVVLLWGYVRYRPSAYINRVSAYLFRGFVVVWVIGFAWTIIELFNPEQGSALLGLIGIRAYWLWWLAPPLIANVLQDDRERRRAIYVIVTVSAGIAAYAVLQFISPTDSAINVYSVVDGEEMAPIVIAATGRGRLAATFSYISGFSDFCILIPTLMLSLGLDAQDRRLQRYALVVTCMTASVVPMSGSRATVLLGGVILVITVWAAGMFFTRVGRRILIGGSVAAVMAVVAFPDAFLGVQSRWSDAEEANTRYVQAIATVVPPMALVTFDYPAFGLGTGMLQNARASLGVPAKMDVEAEVGRYLVELGPFGFAMVWMTKLGLAVALLRGYLILKQAGRRGAAAAALSYGLVTLIGNMAFDHIWQALYFLGCGFILAEVASALRGRVEAERARVAALAT